MESVLLQPPMDERSPDPGPSPKTSYDRMLRDSIQRFLAGISRGGFDFAGFRSVMSRQLQSSTDPPLEIVWLYSAASCYESIAAKNSSDRISSVRDLLHLLSTLSAVSDGAKCIGLIAPAVYDLHGCAVEGLADKKEMEGLAEAILSYISICSGQPGNSEEIPTGLHPCFLDLVKAWTMRCPSVRESLEAFFPLINGGARRRFEMEGCGVDYLAGVVIAEAFLLRLCLKVKGGGASRKQLQKEFGIWAVSSITALRNLIFFEILLEVLLDPKLIAVSILNAEEEKLVRGVLYDAVVLLDYSFHFPVKTNQSDRIRNILMKKLMVTNEAVRIARAEGDHAKAISYFNAFSTSSLPGELIILVHNQIGNSSSEKPYNNSLEGLLKWLVRLEQTGRRIFDDEVSRYAAQLTFDESTLLAVESASAATEKMDADLFFFDKGVSNDDEMESMSAMFCAAARSMRQDSTNGRVKRKELTNEAGKPFKFVKYGDQICQNGDREADDMSSDTDDMDESDQD